MSDRKSPTGKTRFPTADQAWDRLQQLYTPCDVVSCGQCGGYHLTSSTAKRWKTGKVARSRRVPRR